MSEKDSRFVIQKGEVNFLTPEEVEKVLTHKYKPFGENKDNEIKETVKKDND